MARAPMLPGAAPTVASTLSVFRYGAGDPTCRLGPGWFARATLTPDGPGTVVIRWSRGDVEAEAHGPGRDWLLAQAPAMTGALDPGHDFTDGHPVLLRAQRNHPWLRFGASGTPYHELLPVILGQRITAGEAIRQWRMLTYKLGEPAPGPLNLRLPPAPDRLAGMPAWWFHRYGIEAKRAETLRAVARHHRYVERAALLPVEEAGMLLRQIPGVGVWTVGSVLGQSAGDPDAVAVGDFHLKHMVVHAFTGRARGTDEEMLELLAPYAGQRGRVVRLLQLDGHREPKFGPRQRVLPMNRW